MKEKRSLFFDTNLIYFLVIASFVAIRIFSSIVPLNSTGSNIFGIIIQVVCMFLIPFVLYRVLRKKSTKSLLEDFHVKKINIKAVLIAIGIGVIIYFLNLAVASFFSIIIDATGYDPSFGMASTGNGGEYTTIAFLGDILVTAILPGICEEFCHRGLLVNGFKQLKPKKAMLLVGLLFGLMHLNIEQFFYATVIGIFLTFLVYLTDSIIPSIIIHFLNNAIGIYLTFASANNLPFGNFASGLESALLGDPFTVFGTVILIIVLMLGLLALLTYLLLKQTRVKDFQKIATRAIKNKQREELLESFDLDVKKLNKEQGIEEDNMVVFGEPVIRNGRKNITVDFNFGENNLLSQNFKKPSIKDKAFLYGTLFIGVFITLSTLIWGIL